MFAFYRGPIHDAVRKEAVAPKPRQLVRKPRLLEPLSDPEDEEPQIVRSYVKPSKNIDTYNQMVREERQLNAMMKHSSPSSRATENKEPKRKRKSELFKRVFGNSLPPSVPRKSSSSLTSSRVSPPDRIPCYKKSHDSVRPQNLSRTPAHDVPVKRRKEDPEGSSKSRVTPAPHRLQVKSSALPIPSTSNSDHIRSHAPPVHREPKVVRENALKPVEKNQPRKTCHEVEAKRSRSSTAFRPVLEWNEHLNMAYLHKRRQKFFTLKSLPESELEDQRLGDFASVHKGDVSCDMGSSTLPLKSIKQEVVEDDEIEVLFSGRREVC
ncbi:hypothetical protein Q1695_015696 [Nippostrongylus brasiliensis]|nr:hypothetical protein Q1695_015696 [Nippostrongylus brasiliensis]